VYEEPAAKRVPWPFAWVFHPTKDIVPFARVPCEAKVTAPPTEVCFIEALVGEPEVAPFELNETAKTSV
jgi:hypothetical protein